MFTKFTAFCRKKSCPTASYQYSDTLNMNEVIITDDYEGSVRIPVNQYEALFGHHLQSQYTIFSMLVLVSRLVIGVLKKEYSVNS